MLYDLESGKIKISLEEFITIARRGISPTLPFDEDAPAMEEQNLTHLKYISPDIKRERAIYGFSAMGYDFELYLSVLMVASWEVIIAKEVSSNPQRLSRDEEDMLRTEGFIAAKVMGDLSGMEEAPYITYHVENQELGIRERKTEHPTMEKINKFFDRCVGQLIRFAGPEVDRVTRRVPSFRQVKFPYQHIREGQREFMKEAYRSLYYGSVLFAQAPTGTGKTISAIFPAVKALGKGRAEKAFYLTPKGTTAKAACDAIDDLCRGGAIIKAVVITAKERMCINGNACRTSRYFCKYSKCERIAEATVKLYENVKNCLTFRDIIPVAREYGVCPYELILAYSEICDIVICDFNYLFDPHVYLRRFFDKGGRYLFLIDEAHNLVERSREMYSAPLMVEEVDAPANTELLDEHSPLRSVSRRVKREIFDTLYPYIKEELRENKDGVLVGATHISEVPMRLYRSFEELTVTTEEALREALRGKDTELIGFLKQYSRTLKKFYGAMQRFDDTYKLIIFLEDGVMKLKILSLHTGRQIRKMLGRGHGALLFSATLSPINYYRASLGGENQDPILEVESPFATEQLSVAIMDRISTRYSEREDTLLAVCRAIAATVSARRGNYMVFSPSFAYSEALHKIFSERYPKIKTLCQRSDMTAAEKSAFLLEFKKPDSSYLIGFAVMGGIYSEGIDLAGDSLIGAVVVGIGIPGLSYEREAIAEYYEEKYEEGKQFAYVYPGMNRVFQAAGRVIRRESDRGVIVLIDDRFDDPIYKKSLPRLWGKVKFIGDAKTLREELDKFWETVDEEQGRTQ